MPLSQIIGVVVILAFGMFVAPVILRLITPPPAEDRTAIARYVGLRGGTVVRMSKMLTGGPFFGRGGNSGWRADLDRPQRQVAGLPPRPYRVTARTRDGAETRYELAVIGLKQGGAGRLQEKHGGVWKDVH